MIGHERRIDSDRSDWLICVSDEGVQLMAVLVSRLANDIMQAEVVEKRDEAGGLGSARIIEMYVYVSGKNAASE